MLNFVLRLDISQTQSEIPPTEKKRRPLDGRYDKTSLSWV